MTTKYCIVCRASKNGSECERIDELIKEVLESLTHLVLDLTQDPVICDNCIINLKTLFDFTSKCIESEDVLYPYTHSRKSTKFNLKELLYTDKETNEYEGVCRLCKKLVDLKLAKPLVQTLDEYELVDIVECYLSEITISAVNNSIICSSCILSLRNLKDFIYLAVDKADTNNKADINDNKNNVDINKFYNCSNDGQNKSIEKTSICSSRAITEENKTSSGQQHCMQIKAGRSEKPFKLFKCNDCQYGTRHKSGITKHVEKHLDPSKIKMVTCEYCSYKTRYGGNLRRHMLKHKTPSEIVMHECKLCDYVTKNKGDLREHIRVHKDPSEIKMYKCDHCPFETKNRTSLRRHRLIHMDPSEIAMLKCDVCSYETDVHASLKQHYRLHQNPATIKMFKCDLCPYNTLYACNLRKHVLCHTDNSDATMYQCSDCNFQSKHKHYLKLHILKHQNETDAKVYCCSECSYRSKWKTALNRYRYQHRDKSKLEKFNCHSCDYTTHNKIYLGVHRSRNHKNLCE